MREVEPTDERGRGHIVSPPSGQSLFECQCLFQSDDFLMRPRSPSRGRNVNNSVTVRLGFGLDTEGADICQGVGKCPTFGGCESSRASRRLSIIS